MKCITKKRRGWKNVPNIHKTRKQNWTLQLTLPPQKEETKKIRGFRRKERFIVSFFLKEGVVYKQWPRIYVKKFLI